jgi:ribosomal protein S30
LTLGFELRALDLLGKVISQAPKILAYLKESEQARILIIKTYE